MNILHDQFIHRYINKYNYISTGAVESAGSGLASYISSVGGDSYWAVCHLTAPIANTDSIKPLVNSVYTVNI